MSKYKVGDRLIRKCWDTYRIEEIDDPFIPECICDPKKLCDEGCTCQYSIRKNRNRR